MKLTRHRTESVYRRYAFVSETDLAEGMANLSALHEAGGAPRNILPFQQRKGKARPKQER